MLLLVAVLVPRGVSVAARVGERLDVFEATWVTGPFPEGRLHALRIVRQISQGSKRDRGMWYSWCGFFMLPIIETSPRIGKNRIHHSWNKGNRPASREDRQYNTGVGYSQQHHSPRMQLHRRPHSRRINGR